VVVHEPLQSVVWFVVAVAVAVGLLGLFLRFALVLVVSCPAHLSLAGDGLVDLDEPNAAGVLVVGVVLGRFAVEGVYLGVEEPLEPV
jgi:hypothetical protein